MAIPEKTYPGEIDLGDMISRLKRGPFAKVVHISRGALSVWFTLESPSGSTWRIRPGNTAKLWRLP